MLLHIVGQGEYTDRPLVTDDVSRGRYRALVVAPLRCGAARVVRPRAQQLLAIIHRRELKIIDAMNASCEHRREMGVFMSDAIVSFVCRALGLSSVRVRAVLLCVLTPGLVGLLLDKAHCCGNLWGD